MPHGTLPPTLYGSDDDGRSEAARLAVKRARAQQPYWEATVRMMLRDSSAIVRLTGGTPCTTIDPQSGKKIVFIRVPIEMGNPTPHEKNDCGRRGSDLVQLCPLCAILEDVHITIVHECAHHIGETFLTVDDAERKRLLQRSVDSGATSMERALVIRERIEEAARKHTSYIGMASLVSPWMPLLINAMEDIRVNTLMREARPGTTVQFSAQTNKVFDRGIKMADGSTMKWSDQPLNMQAMIGVYCAVGELEYESWIDPKVTAALRSPEVDAVVRQARTARNAAETYRLAFPMLEALRVHGFMIDQADPGPPPPPPAPEEQSEAQEKPGEQAEDQPEQPAESPEGDSSEENGEDDSGPDGADQDQDQDGTPDQDQDQDGTSGPESAPDGPDGADQDQDPTDQDGGQDGPETADQEPGDGAEGTDPSDDGDSSAPEPGDGQAGGDGDPDSDLDTGDTGEQAEGTDGGQGQPGSGGERERQPDDDLGLDESPADQMAPPSDEPGNGMKPTERNWQSGLDDYHSDPDDDSIDGDGDPSDEGDASSDLNDDGPEPDDDEEFDYGTPDYVRKGFDQFGRHDDEEPEPGTHPALMEHEEEKVEEEIETAIVQAEHFDKPSVLDEGLKVHKHSDAGGAWAGSQYGYEGELDTIRCPEAILAPALQKLRIVFSDNAKGSYSRNRRSGNINARVLARRVPTGDNRIFQKKTLPGKKDYFVVIGLDVSGSTAGGKIQTIKAAAMAQAELCHRVGVKFAVYAHSGTRSVVDIFEVKAPEEMWNDETRRRLVDLHSYSANLDGHTLEFYRKVAERRPETDRIILYYTDGKMPLANYEEELDVLQTNIEKCRQLKITLVGVGVGTSSPNDHGLDTIRLDRLADVPKVVDGLKSRIINR